MQLTKNFKLEEFLVSAAAQARGIENVPDNFEQVENLYYLCKEVLQPIRDKFGAVIITSGLRNKQLNEIVGGVSNSQHVLGEAADIKVPGADIQDVIKWIKDNLVYDQVINEFNQWIHISYKKDILENRVMSLVAYKDIGTGLKYRHG